jgi:site-specific DNA recombinase
MNNKLPPIPYAIYTRVSTEEQTQGEFTSLDAQFMQCKSYMETFKDKNYVFYKHYCDDGYSGATLNRPAIKELIHDIKLGKIKVVVFYKIDRLSRNKFDFYNLLQLFQEYEVNFISTSQHIDTSTPVGRLMLGMLIEFAQFERELTSERTKDKMLLQAKKGLWHGGFLPYGYKKDPDKKGILLIEPYEAEIVKEIFSLFLKHKNLTFIANELNKRKITTKNGSSFTKSTIRSILKNPIYAGYVRHKDNLYKGKHKPIISEGVFNKVQEIFKSNAEKFYTKPSYKKNGYCFLLQGKIICGICKSYMVPSSVKKKDIYIPYYRCTKQAHLNKTACSQKMINAPMLDSAIKDKIIQILEDKNFIKNQISSYILDHKNIQKKIEKDLDLLEKQKMYIQNKLNRIVSTIEKGADWRILHQKVNEYENKLKEIEERMLFLSENKKSFINYEVVLKDLPSHYKKLAFNLKHTKDSQKIKQILNLLIHSVIYTENQIELNLYGIDRFAQRLKMAP